MDIKSTPEQAFRKVTILVPLLIVIGLLIYFLANKAVGMIIIIAGIAGAIFGIFLVLKAKKENPKAAKKLFSIYYILAGSILLFLAFLIFIFERENIRQIYIEIIMGAVFLIYGIYSFLKKE
ncbi:hypothetical protein GOV13_03555 [Candidatus Pacearchaeota archaeon]|nr:hypothetical protein [Candidatus Pacearchaeota archaeon]